MSSVVNVGMLSLWSCFIYIFGLLEVMRYVSSEIVCKTISQIIPVSYYDIMQNTG